MKIAGITLERPAGTQTVRLDGRAPLAAGLTAACRPGGPALAALAGSAVGAFVFLPFGPALRCCGILILICAVLSAFRDTRWARHALFRPLAASAATLAVELAYFCATTAPWCCGRRPSPGVRRSGPRGRDCAGGCG